jgi:hypothetical protein
MKRTLMGCHTNAYRGLVQRCSRQPISGLTSLFTLSSGFSAGALGGRQSGSIRSRLSSNHAVTFS